MKILRLVVLLILCNTIKTGAQAPKTSDSIEIYLLTASPGNETYSAFGHSAIRVFIPSQGVNIVYNYGTFDFDTPNFYLKFSTGKLMYYLSWVDYNGFVYAYNVWGQALYEQKILLTQKESQKLVQLLDENYKEENRYYRYGFLYDNCATRIRDIIEKAIDGKIIYNSSYVQQKETFRQLVGNYLNKTPWIHFGINLLLGTGTDSIATVYNYMFLPEHLRDIFAGATIIHNNGIERKLTAQPVELYPSKIEFTKTSPILYPESIFSICLLLVLVLTYFEKKNKLKLILFDRLLFTVSGLLGLLISALWIWSLHKELENNFNAIWANPINLFIGIALLFKKQPSWLKYLLTFYVISLIVFLPVSFFIIQSLPIASYPLSGILLIRTLSYLTNKKTN